MKYLLLLLLLKNHILLLKILFECEFLLNEKKINKMEKI